MLITTGYSTYFMKFPGMCLIFSLKMFLAPYVYVTILKKLLIQDFIMPYIFCMWLSIIQKSDIPRDFFSHATLHDTTPFMTPSAYKSDIGGFPLGLRYFVRVVVF